MRASPAVRGLRAAVFAALCVLLGVGGHALATGMAPPVWEQVAGFLPVFAGGFLLGGRERSLVAIGGGTLAAQGGLHVAFGAALPPAVTAMRGMHMATPHGLTAHGLTAHALTPHALTPHATLAHVSAALLMTWWLRCGEAALWTLLRRAVALVPGLAAWWQVLRGGWTVPGPPGGVRRAGEGARALRRVLLRHEVQRRGPPAGTPYAI
ncbi:hypothetical protein ADK57_24900 [Streptomyces sp. MMG1533]|uniref:hypothetical protein n=1 Tax=Streptomyces sp. MMG1533 TaxID=1415546 RepID=UPI0006AF3A71|nr:hypothetical protein [Streptomyces sp. MMG1533]KOU62382.1 hypothetical protein ADK57_24900 [Streptomyces sp. MMG1533]